MTPGEIRTAVLSSLSRVAPEIDTRSIDGAANLRDQLDIDSMDFLNFVLGLHDRLRVDVPESDYAKLSTIDSAVTYLANRMLDGEPEDSVVSRLQSSH